MILKRLTLTDHSPTYGVLVSNDIPLCVTLERPWINNQNNVSCIPEGTYKVSKFDSPSKGKVFLLHDVPNRTMIEIHAANTINDLLGCIGVGMNFYQGGIATSRMTLDRLLKDLPDEFDLTIINPKE